jgi:hypothetical protein
MGEFMPAMEKLRCQLDSHPDSILSSLEPDQLTAAKQHFMRRTLKGPEILLLWSLRIYLLFMIAVVIYQLWTGAQ